MMTLDPHDMRPATTGRSAVGQLRDGRGEAIVYAWPVGPKAFLVLTWTKQGALSARLEPRRQPAE